MSLLDTLKERSGSKCELCSSLEDLKVYQIPPVSLPDVNNSLLACATCVDQIENPEITDQNHWRCLNESMWSEHDAVKVVAWRMLFRLKNEGWPQDLLDMMYLEDDLLEFAKSNGEGAEEKDVVLHKDANGVVLESGDSVVLVKDLKVKGSSMVAKQGTAVRNIRLDHENDKYIEGKVGGTKIVIITDFVKKL